MSYIVSYEMKSSVIVGKVEKRDERCHECIREKEKKETIQIKLHAITPSAIQY